MLPVDAEAERGGGGGGERFMIAVERESGAKVPLTSTLPPLYTSTTNPSNHGDRAAESQTSVSVTLGQTDQRTHVS